MDRQMRFIMIFLCLVFIQTNSFSQDYSFLNLDTVYVEHVKTVQLKTRGANLSLPVVSLEGSSKLDLTFDDMDADDKDYIYQIFHCDRFWKISDLEQVEYMDGFNDEEIDNVTYSSTAYSNYTNYQLTLPNDDTNWLISGNYILVVIDEEVEEVVFTRRFLVVDEKVQIDATVGRGTQEFSLGEGQEVYFELKPTSLNLNDPNNEISAWVMQNGRWDNAVQNVAPKFIKGEYLVFNHFNEFTFPALTEYRHFDFTDLGAPGTHVKDYFRNRDDMYCLLFKDEPLVKYHYVTKDDFNGNFLVRGNGRSDASLEYASVIFTLETGKEIDDAEIYAFGKFSDWQLKPEFKLEYDPTKKSYVGEGYFKQGYYNYLYASLQDGIMSIGDIEGNWTETENDYNVLVYYHPYGARYDELIGVGTLNSLKNWRNR